MRMRWILMMICDIWWLVVFSDGVGALSTDNLSIPHLSNHLFTGGGFLSIFFAVSSTNEMSGSVCRACTSWLFQRFSGLC